LGTGDSETEFYRWFVANERQTNKTLPLLEDSDHLPKMAKPDQESLRAKEKGV